MPDYRKKNCEAWCSCCIHRLTVAGVAWARPSQSTFLHGWKRGCKVPLLTEELMVFDSYWEGEPVFREEDSPLVAASVHMSDPTFVHVWGALTGLYLAWNFMSKSCTLHEKQQRHQPKSEGNNNQWERERERERERDWLKVSSVDSLRTTNRFNLKKITQVVVTHTIGPSTQEADKGTSEFKASLFYRVSYRTARATQRIPVLKNNNKSHQVVQAFNPSTQVAEGGGTQGGVPLWIWSRPRLQSETLSQNKKETTTTTKPINHGKENNKWIKSIS